MNPTNVLSAFGSFGFSALGLLLLALAALGLSAYVKIATVLGVLRVGLGWRSVPALLLTGILALALSFFVMSPTIERAAAAVDRSLAGKGDRVSDNDRAAALEAGAAEWRIFLERHASSDDQQRFAELAAKLDGAPSVAPGVQGSWRVLVPAFVLTQLRSAFAVALLVLLPLVLIDLLVASACAALSFDQLNSQLLALPLKLLLFVSVDGWTLITTNLVTSFS